jgi:hypothetical protein
MDHNKKYLEKWGKTEKCEKREIIKNVTGKVCFEFKKAILYRMDRCRQT